MTNLDRFTDRVENYARYRPGYPEAVAEHLADFGLREDAQVIDVGSGTGILTRLLLDRGANVYAVEPNLAMRREAERELGNQPLFHSIEGTAEATTLPASSFDLIVAGQAFHWFDPRPTRREWQRLLRKDGWVGLVWNELTEEEEVARRYRKLANAFVDAQDLPARSRLTNPTSEIAAFFAPNPVEQATFPNEQLLDLDGLKGRALSSSYWPNSGEPLQQSLELLEALFETFEVDGKVRLLYRTELFLGQLKAPQP